MLRTETFLLGVILFYILDVVEVAAKVIFWNFGEDSLTSRLSLLDGGLSLPLSYFPARRRIIISFMLLLIFQTNKYAKL